MGGGFGGQQQQGGFGGGFGMPQQQQGGSGGGFGGQQGFSGGFQPSRQRFNQMPQQQGFGNTFARTMPPQQGFGPGINNYAGPQQPQGFGGFDMFPQQQQQQQRQYPAFSSINSTPDLSLTARPQGFGSNLGNFLGRQGFNMPQRHGGDMPMISSGGFDPASGKFSPPKDQYGNPVTKPMRDPMRPMVSFPAPQQDFNQPSAVPAPSSDMNAMMDPFRQQANQMLAAQDAALRSRGMPTSNEIDFTDPRLGQSISFAQPPKQQPQAQTNQPPASMEDLASALRGMGGMGGGSQPVLGTPGGNLVGGMDPRMLRPNVNRPLPQQQMPPNPYAQQVRQEDPRMQAMRMMQRMNFGGGGGYNF